MHDRYVMTSRLARVPLWCWWIPIVWIVSFPWSGLSAHPQQPVHLVPFTDPADKPSDVAANILLFVPFGYSFARRPRTLPGLVATALAAGAVSASAEALQLFGTGRYASTTDITCAIAGGIAGAWWRLRRT